MRYSIVADNYTMSFGEDENVVCYEAYYNAKNVELILTGELPLNAKCIGIHVRGFNTAANPTLKIVGTVFDNGVGSGTSPIIATASSWGNFDLLSAGATAGAFNWLFTNHIVNTQYNINGIKLKIDTTSSFTGHAYIRIFFKLM